MKKIIIFIFVILLAFSAIGVGEGGSCTDLVCDEGLICSLEKICVTCTDTDNGNDPDIQGTATNVDGMNFDACVDSVTLNEFHCNGNVELTVVTCPFSCFNGECTLCGNGILDGDEACDDGNPTTGDGCSIACSVESGYICPTVGQLCVHQCGDGIIQDTSIYKEDCDDFNTANGDGCSSTCQKDPAYDCVEGQLCTHKCGDGIRDDFSGYYEACDDGGNEPKDGCSSVCEVESGWYCAPNQDPCVELCDDGSYPGSGGYFYGDTGCPEDLVAFNILIAGLTQEVLDIVNDIITGNVAGSVVELANKIKEIHGYYI
jgi:cysteine-rich repeat protein